MLQSGFWYLSLQFFVLVFYLPIFFLQKYCCCRAIYTFSIPKLLAAKSPCFIVFHIILFHVEFLFGFFFIFHLKKKSLSFSFSIPASIWQDFSRSPPPEPAPHDPALLVYKQQLQHLESNRGGAFDLNPEHQSQDSCNSQM